MKQRFKKILSIALAFIVIFLVFLNFSNKKVDDFTVEEHRQRITQRIKESNSRWGFPEGEKYQDFEVYPLYNVITNKTNNIAVMAKYIIYR